MVKNCYIYLKLTQRKRHSSRYIQRHSTLVRTPLRLTAKAAEARRQEDVPFDRDNDKSHYWGARLPRGSSNPARLGVGITQAPDGSHRENLTVEGSSVGNTNGNSSGGGIHEPEQKPEPRVIRLSQPKPPQEPITTKSKGEVEKSKVAEGGPTGTQPVFRPYTSDPHRAGASVSPRRGEQSREVASVVPGGGGQPTETSDIDYSYSNKEASNDRSEPRPANKVASDEHINRCADDGHPRHGSGEQRTRTDDSSFGRFKSLPPNAEVFEASLYPLGFIATCL